MFVVLLCLRLFVMCSLICMTVFLLSSRPSPVFINMHEGTGQTLAPPLCLSVIVTVLIELHVHNHCSPKGFSKSGNDPEHLHCSRQRTSEAECSSWSIDLVICFVHEFINTNLTKCTYLLEQSWNINLNGSLTKHLPVKSLFYYNYFNLNHAMITQLQTFLFFFVQH